jgi:hypothetical protein
MLRVTVEQGSRITFTDPVANTGFAVAFQRTLRIPDDGKDYPLPPGLRSFPVRRVLAYRDRVPATWVKTSGVFLPMYQREAMWIKFTARSWRPNAAKVAAGKINAVSGKPWDQTLHTPDRTGREETQDYLTCPPQPWLDGFNTGSGSVRQFVAMPLGMGYTVEGQVTGKEVHGGVQLIVYEPKPGRFPEPRRCRSAGAEDSEDNFDDDDLDDNDDDFDDNDDLETAYDPLEELSSTRGPRSAGKPKARSMGLAGGGKIVQKIYPDPYGIETWDESNYGRVFVHIVNSEMWREITGEDLPPTPVSAHTYTQHGFPWFKLYDEHQNDLPPSTILSGVKPVAAMDALNGFVGSDDDESLNVPPAQLHGVRHPNEVPDGDW